MSTRRTFLLQAATLAGAAAVLALPVPAHARKLAIKLSSVPKLSRVGGWVILKLGSREILLIRDSRTSVVAISPICTHLACYVSYNPETRTIDCGCHKSSFDLRGNVLGGPATKDLKTFSAKLDGDRIIVRV